MQAQLLLEMFYLASNLQNFLARNIRTLEKITLLLTFLINMILLFHRVDIAEGEGGEGKIMNRTVYVSVVVYLFDNLKELIKN